MLRRTILLCAALALLSLLACNMDSDVTLKQVEKYLNIGNRVD